jgi:uncharacterized membrane protein
MIEVTRPTSLSAEALWPVLSEVRNWPQWLPTVDAVHPVLPDRPEEVGASYVVEQPGLPRATWTITQWRPGESFTWESRSPGIRSTGVHVLTAGTHGTTIRLGIDWSGPLAGVVRVLLGRRTLRYVTTEAESLELTAARRSRA